MARLNVTLTGDPDDLARIESTVLAAVRGVVWDRQDHFDDEINVTVDRDGGWPLPGEPM